LCLENLVVPPIEAMRSYIYLRPSLIVNTKFQFINTLVRIAFAK